MNGRVLRRVGAGIAVSIALHGSLLFAYRQGVALPWRDNADAPSEALVVTLRAPAPAPAPKAKPAVKVRREKAGQAGTQTAGIRPATNIPATDVIALPDKESNAPEGFTVAPPSGAPQFDPDAARRFAREIATQPDPARAGMAVAQIPPKPYATETKAARVIAQAKRANCKDGIPGGLLAPLVLLLDKKDSGCKW